MTRTFTLERNMTGCVLRDSDRKPVYAGASQYPPVTILELLALRLNCRISDLTVNVEPPKGTP